MIGADMPTDAMLAALVASDPDFARLEAALSVFCPFEAVGMVRQEIRHGRFLEWVLDPARPHGLGSGPLRALLHLAAAAEDDGLSPLDAHLLPLDGARVRRERDRIDLLIEVPAAELAVAIELKVDAAEHGGQLGRYREALARRFPGWRRVLLFVTARGDDPGEEHGDGWRPLGLEALADALAAVAERSPGAPGAAMALAYRGMVRRRIVGDERLEGLAAALWARHRAALEYLSERRPDSGAGVLGELGAQADALAARLGEAAGLPVVADHARGRAITFAVPAWDALPGSGTVRWTPSGRILLLELTLSARADGDIVAAMLTLGPGDPDARRRIHAALHDAGVKAKPPKTDRWTRLVRDTLARDDEDDGLAADAVAERLVDFARRYLPRFDRALRPLLGA